MNPKRIKVAVKASLLAFLILLSFSAGGIELSTKEHKFLPLLIYSERMEPNIGVLYLGDKAFLNWADILAGGVAAKSNIFFLGLTDAVFPLFGFNFGWVIFSSRGLELPVSFSRGMDNTDLYYADMDINGSLLYGSTDFLDETITFKINSINTLTGVNSFRTKKNKNIFTPGFKTNQFPFSIYRINSALNLVNNIKRPTSGFQVIYDQYAMSSYRDFASYINSEFEFKFFVPLNQGNDYLTFGYMYAGSNVLTEKITDSSELYNSSDISCDSLSDSDRINCEEVKTGLAGLAAEHNKRGTSTMLGGPYRIRSDFLYRFKGSVTDYAIIKYSTILKRVNESEFIELDFYIERGRAYDRAHSSGQRTPVTSVGAEYRYNIFNSVVKLDIAFSQDNSGIHLIYDNPW